MTGKSRYTSLFIACFLVLPAVFLTASCSMFRKPVTGIAVVLPRDTDVPGWERIAYGVAAGSEGTDQPLETYRDYNVRERARGRYRSYRSGGELTVEVVRCSSVLDAFGIFSVERSRSADPRAVDQSAVTSGTTLLSWKGKYFILVDTPAGNREDLILFLTVVRQNIQPGESGDNLPPFTVLFSPEFNQDGLVFLRKGREEIPMADIYVRTRRIMEKEFQVFFHRAESDEDADRKFTTLSSRTGGFILSRADHYPLAIREMEGGRVVNVSRFGPWVFGVLNASSREEGLTIMAMLNREIRDFR